MSERQAETTMDHDTKPESGSGQSWIHSSFIQTIRPVASLASRLRILPHLYRISYDKDFLDTQYNEEENKKLLDVCKKAENAQIGFISLHIISKKDNETEISQLGMSKWRSDGWTGMVSVHCQVEQEMVVSESGYPRLIAGDFTFGDTEVIVESDVGPWLEATFRSFQVNQDITCLVGHDIHRILHLVQPYWKVPSDVIILDTRAIWESQTQATEHPSFKQTLAGVAHHLDGRLVNNAGNVARLLLKLLQAQIYRSTGKDSLTKDRSMSENMRTSQTSQTSQTWGLDS